MNNADLLFVVNPNKEVYKKAFPVMVGNLIKTIQEVGEEVQNEPCNQFAKGA